MNFTDTPTVFIVDDDASVREGMAWLLRTRRLLSETFESAESFLSMLQLSRHRQRPFGRATLASASGLHFAGRADARHEWLGPV